MSPELLAQGGQGYNAIVDGEKIITELLKKKIERADVSQLTEVLSDLDQSQDHMSLGALTWSLPADETRRLKVLATLSRVGVGLAQTLRGLLDSKAPLVRAHAAGILGKVGDKAAVEKLIDRLGDEHQDVRRKVAMALGRLGDARAVAPLIEILSEDKAFGARSKAALALGLIGDEKAIAPLVAALADEFAFVQADAAHGLGTMKARGAVGPLLSALESAAPVVRLEILRALTRIGGPKALEAIAPYKDDPDPDIRKAVN